MTDYLTALPTVVLKMRAFIVPQIPDLGFSRVPPETTARVVKMAVDEGIVWSTQHPCIATRKASAKPWRWPD